MTEATARRLPRAANARPPGAVLADLAELEKMIAEVRSRYTHAHDLAYSTGGGGGFEAIGRSAIEDSKPTEGAALNEGKDSARHQVAHAGRMVKESLKRMNWAHSALVGAMPGAAPYEQTWVAGKDDPIASEADKAALRRKQEERDRRGEL